MPDINVAYQWGINTCNAPNVGYSQAYRNQRTVNGITYYDCSSFIWYALIAGGWDCVSAVGSTWPFTTATMCPILTGKLGFTEVDINGVWLPGDVIWRSGHTEMVYQTDGVGGGVTMGAHTANAALADQVSINKSTSTASKWSRLFRYGDGGATGYGYSIYVIAALCGNSWRESGINPGHSQVGGTAYGMFQWDGERRTNLENWLTENGYALDSAIGQLEFLIYEDDWIKNFGEYNTLQEFLTSDSTDIPYLTQCFCYNWERPGVVEIDERIAYAQQAAEYIMNHAQDTSITQWYASADALTTEQTLNNAVMMYRYYSTGGGGGTDVKGKHKMPVWMMIRYH